MFHWEPEGGYRNRLCTAIAPFWFSTDHLWTAVAPFWLATDNICVLILVTYETERPCHSFLKMYVHRVPVECFYLTFHMNDVHSVIWRCYLVFLFSLTCRRKLTAPTQAGSWTRWSSSTATAREKGMEHGVTMATFPRPRPHQCLRRVSKRQDQIQQVTGWCLICGVWCLVLVVVWCVTWSTHLYLVPFLWWVACLIHLLVLMFVLFFLSLHIYLTLSLHYYLTLWFANCMVGSTVRN